MESTDRPGVAVHESDLFEVMATCRAMRRLRPDPVPDELIAELIRAAPRPSCRSGTRSADSGRSADDRSRRS